MSPANDNAPRLLSRTEAAAYCGFKPTAFATHVAAGRLPAPLPGLRKWDRKVIDDFLDQASGIAKPGSSANDNEDPWAEYERSKNAR